MNALRPVLPALMVLAGVLAAPTALFADIDSVLRALGADPGASAKPKDDMGGAASWGDSSQPVARPTAPHRTDLPWFQTLVDEAPAGSVLRPPPGRYAGPVVVDKPLTIEGGGQVVIDGGGKGTVFVLQTDGATLREVHLTGSGDSPDTDDACLNLRGKGNRVEGLEIDDCLFGIDLKQADDNLVRANHIRSKPVSLGMRGDSLRLWYSHRNTVEDNRVEDSRDMVVWYSNDNRFLRNESRRSRYSIHFMFAQRNLVEGNRFYDNAVGIYVMYTEGVTIRNNVISHASGAAGMAVGLKEASNAYIEDNEIVYCAVGVGTDISPFEPDSKVVIKGNRLAYNGTAVHFVSEREGTEVVGNIFEGNLAQVAVAGAGSVRGNLWRGNYWDDYQGFDRDGDGVGDRPQALYAYSDQLWMEYPYARFFRNAPMMEALDFLERLAPFSTPQLLLRDDAPRFARPKESRS